MTRSRTFQFISAGIFTMGICLAQPAPPAIEDVPKAEVFSVEPTTDGRLLFAIRIFATSNETLYLHGPEVTPEPGATQSSDYPNHLPFSLNGSTLTDAITEVVYPNSPTLPKGSSVGPMEISTSVQPGGWIQLGVAFPMIPPPPDNEGRKRPYELVLEIPQLKIRTPFKLDPETLKPL